MTMPSCNSLNDSCIGRATHLVGPMPLATVICTSLSTDTILYKTFCTDMCNLTLLVHDSRMRYRYQMLSLLHKHIFVQFCISKSLYNISSHAKLHTSFCYQCVQMPSYAPLCAKLLVQFVYQCKLPYRSVLSALFRCLPP